MQRRLFSAALLVAVVARVDGARAQRRAHVTFVGFQQFEDKRVRLFVHMNAQPDGVSRRGEGREIVYVLSGMDAGVRNNQNPLVFKHFDTPLLRAQLRPSEEGVGLVVTLRQDVEMTHHLERRDDGEVVLQVDVPPPR